MAGFQGYKLDKKSNKNKLKIKKEGVNNMTRQYDSNFIGPLPKGKKRKGYTFAERGAYHAERAKKDSYNRKENRPYTEAERAYSRGWLKHQKINTKAWKYNNSK